MADPRPTIPLVPELIDITRRDNRAGADEALFGGWGIRLPLSIR